jgi:hypothetical protein
MNMIKVFLAASLVTAGLSLARAQEPPANNDVAQIRPTVGTITETTTHTDKQNRASDSTGYPSGFNVGPTEFNVKGCVGPVSYCNLYFGG